MVTGRHNGASAIAPTHGGYRGRPDLDRGSGVAGPPSPESRGRAHPRFPQVGDGRTRSGGRGPARHRGRRPLRGWPHYRGAIVETVVGTNGILIPPDGYMQGLRALCDKHGIMLIADEVMAGSAAPASGSRCDPLGSGPDLMTMAKGITSAYVQLGAVACGRGSPGLPGEGHSGRPHLQQPHPGLRGGPGHDRVYEEEGLLENSRKMGAILNRRMGEIAGQATLGGRPPQPRPLSGSSRWCGTRRPTRPWPPTTAPPRRWRPSAGSSRARASTPSCAGNTFFTNPPLCITEAQLHEGLDVIDKGLEITDRAVTR